jgi:predicted nucleic acid-binding protein
MTILPFDDNTARAASTIYRTLKTQHTLIDIADILIAATSVAQKIPLATLNVRHFQQIAGVVLVVP